MPKDIQVPSHSLRKSDQAIFNAIMKSVREKLKYMEGVFKGPSKRKRRRKKKTAKAATKKATGGVK